MIKEKKILNTIHGVHISEKITMLAKKKNIIVLKVNKNSNKPEIKQAIQKIFSIKVKSVNTLIKKGKIKKQGKKINKQKNWKKAYIHIQNGKNIDFKNKLD